MKHLARLCLSFSLLLLLIPRPAFAGTAYEQLVQYANATVSSGTTDQRLSYVDGSGTVDAIAGKKIRVLGYTVVVGGTATSVTFNSKGAGAGTAISSPKTFAANGGISAPCGEYGCFETKAGEAITVTTGAGSTVGVDITFVYE